MIETNYILEIRKITKRKNGIFTTMVLIEQELEKDEAMKKVKEITAEEIRKDCNDIRCSYNDCLGCVSNE